MMYSTRILPLAALISLVQGHAQILNAQGETGSPASVGFLVDTALARNCTSISPCQQDATIIRDAEIAANIVNECGRTELNGNIDVGENTENALAAGQVTKVKAGTQMIVTIHQVNADGAGPFTCDMDPTGNSLGATGQTVLEVTNNVPGVNGFSQAKTQDFNITVTMPDILNCTGASTGNICTIRCRNNALAGPFGGCFAVQQSDTNTKTNVASDIQTAQKLEQIQAQIQQNQKDLPAAVAAIQKAGSDASVQNLAAVNQLLDISITSKPAAVQTPVANAAGAASAQATGSAASNTTTNAGTGKGTGKKGKGTGKGNGNAASSANAATSSNAATAATAKGSKGSKGKSNNNNNNGNTGNTKNKRDVESVLRWARREVLAGKDFEGQD